MSSRPPKETLDLEYYDHFVGRTLCIVDERHQIDGPSRPMVLVKSAARFYLQNPNPAPEAALHQPPPPIGYNQASLLPAQLQRVMIGCVASACHRLAAQPARLKVHDGMAWRRRTCILVRVLAGYFGRIRRTVVDYRAAAASRIQGCNKYMDDIYHRGIDSAVFRDHIIANPLWAHARETRGLRHTALMLSAYHGRVDCCRFAIDAGADVDTRGENCCTALHVAADRGHVDVCRLLVALGADITLTCRYCASAGGGTLLDHAVRNGHVDVCRYLVELGADVNDSLFHAIQRNHLDVLRYLVSAGADVSACCCRGTTPLSWAASIGQLDMCRYLLDVGADVNAAGDNTPALHLAAQELYFDVCRFLVQNGADVNARDEEGSTALHKSASFCHNTTQSNIELCRFLIEAGANINAQDDEGTTVLHVAIRHWRIEVCRYLLDIGVDVNAKSCHGTPLHVCASEGGDMKDSMLQLLLDAGADVHAVNDNGRTALHAASDIHYYNPRIVATTVVILVKAGAAVNAVDQDGSTALLLAAKKGMIANVRYLVEAGADVKATNNSGATAFELASKTMMHEWGKDIQCYLRSVGAPVPEKFSMW
jgi:ankyrin repeat protein